MYGISALYYVDVDGDNIIFEGVKIKIQLWKWP